MQRIILYSSIKYMEHSFDVKYVVVECTYMYNRATLTFLISIIDISYTIKKIKIRELCSSLYILLF